MKILLLPATLLLATVSAHTAEFHVSAAKGSTAGDGSEAKPFATVSAAADKAMPGDTVTVHAGVYRERVTPPRGGESDAKRITYQAAKGEKAVITGSDVFKTWENVSGDTWKLVIPNTVFGDFNPYAKKVSGDWFQNNGRTHRLGNVYLNGAWLPEAANLNAVTGASGAPAWFSVVDGLVESGSTPFLMNIASLKVGAGASIPAAGTAKRAGGPRDMACSEGGQCVAFISNGTWVQYDKVDFGVGAESVTLRAAAIFDAGGVVELRDGHFDGALLGKCEIKPTGGWQKWQNFEVKIQKTSGEKTLFLVFNSGVEAPKPDAAKVPEGDRKTTIYARFPAGTDPNSGAVEVCMRPTVFTPEKTEINWITLRGFDLRNAASNWAAPTMGQYGLVTAYWNKGWIIEDNEISYARCSGIALGKYSDQWDGKRGTTEGYYLTITDAVRDGWSKERIGSHIVRRNHIHHCGQTGIVGSLGCAFSQVIGNDIHDCNMQGIWGGFEMAGIKFHGAIDVVIADNHIWRNGMFGGIWLDWMAQGVRITGNLLHDNTQYDLFTEVNHGPILIADNLFLSPGLLRGNSHGLAGIHNLMTGGLGAPSDARRTPFMKPHETDQLGLESVPVGDARWHNNILTSRASLKTYDPAGADWPCAMSGNVFAKGGSPSKFDTDAVNAPAFDVGAKLVKKDDGWYLTLATDKAWGDAVKRKLVTTEQLGKAKVPNQGYTLPDGSPISVDTDYFGKPRDKQNPFPGPFAAPVSGEIKVWPKS